MANRYGKAVIPGVMTPTEIVQACSAGASAVKIFPAGILGPSYLRQIRGPLPQIPLIPTGESVPRTPRRSSTPGPWQ